MEARILFSASMMAVEACLKLFFFFFSIALFLYIVFLLVALSGLLPGSSQRPACKSAAGADSEDGRRYRLG